MTSPPPDADTADVETAGVGASSARLLAGLLALFAALGLWKTGRGYDGFDFYQFWVVGQAVAEDLPENVYADADRAKMGTVFFERARSEGASSRRVNVAERRKFIKTWSTPFLYTAFGLLSSGNYERDYTRFQLLCLASTVAAVMLLARAFGWSLAAALLALAAVLQSSTPLLADVRVANVNQLQLLGVTLFLGLAGGRAAATVGGGALLGALCAFKPNLGIVAVLALGLELSRGRWRVVGLLTAGLALGGALAVLAAALFFGRFAAWLDWFGFLRGALYDPERAMTVAHGNASIDRLVFEAAGVHVGSVLGLVLLALVGTVLWRRRASPARAAGAALELHWLVALALCLNLLSAPLSFGHYYVFAIPAVLYCLRPGEHAGARHLVGALALVAFFAPQLFAGLARGAAARAAQGLAVVGDDGAAVRNAARPRSRRGARSVRVAQGAHLRALLGGELDLAAFRRRRPLGVELGLLLEALEGAPQGGRRGRRHLRIPRAVREPRPARLSQREVRRLRVGVLALPELGVRERPRVGARVPARGERRALRHALGVADAARLAALLRERARGSCSAAGPRPAARAPRAPSRTRRRSRPAPGAPSPRARPAPRTPAARASGRCPRRGRGRSSSRPRRRPHRGRR